MKHFKGNWPQYLAILALLVGMFLNPLGVFAQDVPKTEQEKSVDCVPNFQPRLIGNDRAGEYYILLRVNIIARGGCDFDFRIAYTGGFDGTNIPPAVCNRESDVETRCKGTASQDMQMVFGILDNDPVPQQATILSPAGDTILSWPWYGRNGVQISMPIAPRP
jgi:hypothetical protein